jgi:hypothetical protein
MVAGARRPWCGFTSLAIPNHPTRRLEQPHREQRASYWMDVVRVKKGKDGKRRHEDPELVVQRYREERRSDGQSLLDLEAWNDRHEKNWMRRKRLEEKRRYEFDTKHVFDLAKYISFVQENKDK